MTRPRLLRAEPTLRVRDVGEALATYARLGFATEQGKAPDGTTLSYGFLRRDEVHAHVSANPPATGGAQIYLYVEDVDALHAEWEAAGVSGALEAPGDRPYGLREMSYTDADGNRWLVGAEILPV